MTARSGIGPLLPRWGLRLFLALALAVAFASATPVDEAFAGERGDNTAVAVNEEDGSTVLDFAFSIRRVAGEVVDNQNAAVALASCESCQTVALAIQVVLVESAPSTVTPVNAAIALNEECTACTTVALAYQYVLGVNQPLRFTKEGRERIRAIRKELMRLERSGLPLDQILARVAELRADLVEVLTTQLEVDGRGAQDEEEAGEDGDGADREAGTGSGDPGSGRGDESGAEPSSAPGDNPAGNSPGGGSGAEPATDAPSGETAAPSGAAEAPSGQSTQPAP
jgi:putative peptide zinc metalloprotease protein